MVSLITLIDTKLVQGRTAGRPRLHARPDARRLRQLLRLHGPLQPALLAHGRAHRLGHSCRLRRRHAARPPAVRPHRALVPARHGAARLPDGPRPLGAERSALPPFLPQLQRRARRLAARGARHRQHLRLPHAHHQFDPAGVRPRQRSHRHHARRRRREDRPELQPRRPSLRQYPRRAHRHARVLRAHRAF